MAGRLSPTLRAYLRLLAGWPRREPDEAADREMGRLLEQARAEQQNDDGRPRGAPVGTSVRRES